MHFAVRASCLLQLCIKPMQGCGVGGVACFQLESEVGVWTFVAITDLANIISHDF